MSSTSTTYLIPFSTVKRVKGSLRGAIYDLDRRSFEIVPNSLITVLDELEVSSLEYLQKEYSDQINTFSTYIDYLLEKEIVFRCSNKENFPPLSMDWKAPSVITNSIVSTNDYSILYKTLGLLSNLNCQNIQFRTSNIDILKLNQMDLGRIRSIELVVNDSNKLNSKELFQLRKIKTVSKIILLDFDSKLDFDNTDSSVVIQESNSFNNSHKLDSVNITLFTESQNHHTYYNRKILIDINGEIKNSYESPHSFGFIQEIEEIEQLESIISTPEFQKYWNVTKNKSDVCKDCEFRHLCIDKRLPQKRKKIEWYFNEECNYNPYISQWKGEEGYLTLEECGVISNSNEFSINHEKIKAINAKLWA